MRTVGGLWCGFMERSHATEMCMCDGPGMELQRIRNARGLKPSQLARLAGHHSVARMLSEAHLSPQGASAGGLTGMEPARRHRRPAGGSARSDQARTRAAPPSDRPPVSQETIIASIMQVRRHSSGPDNSACACEAQSYSCGVMILVWEDFLCADFMSPGQVLYP
jgi:hypothetical protein